ncbi:MAG: hypothetical protein ACI9SQ_001788 [Rubritalea sp.]|jgi:hypothetical protein
MTCDFHIMNSRVVILSSVNRVHSCQKVFCRNVSEKSALLVAINLRVNYPVFSDAYCIGFASK